MASMETGLMVMDGMVNQPMRQPVIQMQQIQLIQQQISLTNVLQINVQKAADEQDKLNQNVNKSTSSMSALAAKASETFKSFFNTESLKKGIETVIGEASKMQDKMISVQGMLGDKGAGTAYFNHLQKQANESGFSFDELKNNAQSFMGVTKNTESLDKLANLSERLSLGNSGAGMSGAGDAIKSMLSGDGDSLQSDFGFNSEDIGILQASKDLDDFSSKFDQLLNDKGLDASMLDGFNNSASAQFDNLKENFNSSLGDMGGGLLEAFTPVMQMLNEMFSNGSFQVFFDAISIGIQGIINLIFWIGNAIQTSLPIVLPIILGIIGALAIWRGCLLAIALYQGAVNLVQGIFSVVTGQATLAQLGLNTAMYGCPLVWIIALILGVIIAIGALIAFCEPFRKAFAGAFQGIADACSKAFGIVVDCIQGVLNWIIDKINDLLHGINNITGTAASLWGGSGTDLHIDKVDFSGFKQNWQDKIQSIGNTGANAIENFSIENIKAKIKGAMNLDGMKNDNTILNSYNEDNMGNNFNNSLLNQGGNNSGGIPSPMGGGSDALTSAIDNTNMGQNVECGSESLKGINDSVEVSNENLDLMNDLAELESIQNFITLTPTVQVTTGDIKEEADIDTIISRIESYMENEMTNSAEGLYA
ncbi:tail length tape measure protein [uncultured Clostridium sp.]|uniref:tail length tape measure protein n=1 Tax=uncultured Clostridium sp. TaxID=59620 RepID=UPI0028E69861|nr:tail length tape measure protein [uncultured Clostridium sp.]